MPRFSIKDLLVSTTVVAVGAVLLHWVMNWSHRYESGFSGMGAFTVWLAAGAIIGAGVLWPIRQSPRGAVAGLVAQIAILLMLLTWRLI